MSKFPNGSDIPTGSIATHTGENFAGFGVQQSVGAVLTTPRGLRRIRAKLGSAQVAPVYISCWGDSITEGVGAESSTTITSNIASDTLGWAGQLRGQFARHFGTLGGGAIFPYYTGADTRVTRSGSPTADLTLSPIIYGGRLKTSTSDYFEFVTPACTAIDILYYAGGSADGSLIGGFSYQVDGGTVTTGLAAGVNGAPGYRVLTLSGLANATHTIRLVGLSATNLQHIAGIRYHNNQGVVISRFGRAGWTILDMHGVGEGARNNSCSSSAYNRARIAAAIGGFGEHLTIIALGENDAVLQATAMGGGSGEPVGTLYTSPATYETYLRARVASIAAAGGCTLLLNTALPPPSNTSLPGGSAATRYAYHDAMRRIAEDPALDHVAHLSIADRWGISNDLSIAENVTLGNFWNASSVHPTPQGYGDMAAAIFEALTRTNLVA